MGTKGAHLLSAARFEAMGTKMGLVSMRFDDAGLEAGFRDAYARNSVRIMKIAAALGALQYGAFGLLDLVAVPGSHRALFVIRFGIVCPYLLLVIPVMSTSLFLRRQQVIVASSILVPAFGLVAMFRVAPVPSDYVVMGTMLLLVFTLTFIRLRFLYGAIAALIIVAAYEAGAIAWTDLSVTQLIYNNFFLLSVLVVGMTTSYVLERFTRRDFLQARVIEMQRVESETLLLNILPEAVAERLKRSPGVVADSFDDVTVLFADIVGFTPISAKLSAQELVRRLDAVFSAFDGLCILHGLEKIKTIGDAYMAVSGVPYATELHAHAAAEMALDMRTVALGMASEWEDGLRLRIGICSGPVVAGVIGKSKFAYDLWGDTVNTASRMESHGEPSCIQVSRSTYEQLDNDFEFSEGRTVEIKGKGAMTTHFLLGRRTVPAELLHA